MMDAQKKITIMQVEQTQNNDIIPFPIETYECFHFDSFFIACAKTTITCYQ
jgi:hypothetical protein